MIRLQQLFQMQLNCSLFNTLLASLKNASLRRFYVELFFGNISPVVWDKVQGGPLETKCDVWHSKTHCRYAHRAN